MHLRRYLPIRVALWPRSGDPLRGDQLRKALPWLHHGRLGPKKDSVDLKHPLFGGASCVFFCVLGESVSLMGEWNGIRFAGELVRVLMGCWWWVCCCVLFGVPRYQSVNQCQGLWRLLWPVSLLFGVIPWTLRRRWINPCVLSRSVSQRWSFDSLGAESNPSSFHGEVCLLKPRGWRDLWGVWPPVANSTGDKSDEVQLLLEKNISRPKSLHLSQLFSSSLIVGESRKQSLGPSSCDHSECCSPCSAPSTHAEEKTLSSGRRMALS